MTILQSAAKFGNMVPWSIWFFESPNKYVYEFLIRTFEYMIALICAGRKKSTRANCDVTLKFNITN